MTRYRVYIMGKYVETFDSDDHIFNYEKDKEIIRSIIKNGVHSHLGLETESEPAGIYYLPVMSREAGVYSNCRYVGPDGQLAKYRSGTEIVEDI